MKFTRQNKLIAILVSSVLVIPITCFYLISNNKKTQEISDSKVVQSDSIATSINNPDTTETIEEMPTETIFEEFEPKEVVGKTFRINDTIEIIPKKIIADNSENCELEYSWEELKFSKPKVAEIINRKIKDYVNYALENCQNSENPCSGCNLIGRVNYLSSNQIGISLVSSQPVAGGIIHNKGHLHFKTRNGEAINFHDLIKPELIKEFDSLLFKNLQSKYNITTENHYLDQFKDLNFLFDPNGIEFSLYDLRGNFIIETNLSRKEIEPFLIDGFPNGKFR